ncbi:MAG TPA: serine/threonine-protein kinase [Polyangiaceae bacterium]|nr:serine/threonine-protein kinase [Polyangiaceae bacterium]HOD20835.1 serine/threonine-protein kinase [Polyangiaceae bacterium]HOE47255.1 serine/threonine-protein kinase [Polyangiaceae bacterium]HOG99079.1 serine/threonine-protein kinase [Polyangiaceae bacterium]HOR33470.1 serine/threonine-protein kinase [Polyangiaceae bacterium]
MTSAPALTQLAAPRTFGRYQLFDRIGAGGMAEIYLARATTELGGARLTVVKQIRPELSGNEKFAEMLTVEAKLAARLNHANIVQVFDLGRHENVLFIAMEYVEGFDLNELLRRCARAHIPLPVDFALLIIMEALRGLSYAHRLVDDRGEAIGLVHRDVSPSNVLISFEGEVKLCDFGIARANDMADLLSDDVIKGKAGYMSPEQAFGEPLDARADLFAAGIVLWELLAGRKLYRAPKENEKPTLLDQARAAVIPDLPSRGLPDESVLNGIVRRALARNRDDRYASAQQMLRDLEQYVGQARLMASPIRFGEWLRENFEENVIALRRSRERAAKALQQGPAATVEPYGTPPPPPTAEPQPSAMEPAPVVEQTPNSSPQPRSNLALYIALGVFIGFVIVGVLWALT